MSLGVGFSVTQNEEFQANDFIPATPEKRSYLTPLNENQMGGANWQERADVYIPEMPNYNTIGQNVDIISHYECDASMNQENRADHIASYRTQFFQNASTSSNKDPFVEQMLWEDPDSYSSVNSTLGRIIDLAAQRPLLQKWQSEDINISRDYNPGGFSLTKQNYYLGLNPTSSMVKGPLIPKVLSQVENSSRDSKASNLLLSNQNHCLGSYRPDGGNSNSKIPYYGLSIPSQSSYDLNSSPRTEADSLPSITNSLQFTPITPDQDKKSARNQLSLILNSIIDESKSQEKDWQVNLVVCQGKDTIQQHCSELQNIVDTSCAGISTPYEENKDSDKRSDRGIDPNKTPEQKPPRRRKHRPKVIEESKPKRTRKPAVPRNTESKESHPGKRKYVRKKALNKDTTREAADANTGKATKSCRRVLNFDLDRNKDDNQGEIVAQPEERQQQTMMAPNTTSDSQAKELCSGTDHIFLSAVQSGLHKSLVLENQKPGQASIIASPSMNQLQNDNSLTHRQVVLTTPRITAKDISKKDFHIASRYLEKGNTDLDQNICGKQYTPMQQHTHAEEKCQDGSQGEAYCGNLGKNELITPSISQPSQETLSNSNEERGFKRGHCHITRKINHCPTKLMGSDLCKEVFQVDECHRNDNFLTTGFSQTHKKKKIGTDNTNIYKIPCIEEAEDLGKDETTRANDVHPKGLTSKLNLFMLNSNSVNNRIAETRDRNINKFNSDSFHCTNLEHNLLKQQISSQPHFHIERMKSTSGPSQVHSFYPQTTVEKCSHLQPPPCKESPGQGNWQMFHTCNNNMLAKKQTVETTPFKSASSEVQKMLQTFCEYQQSSIKRRGPKKKQTHPIEEIIFRFKGLNLNESSDELQRQEQNAIVPYKGDGAVVPYEGFEYIKKHRPRPKVDLDPETNRIWNFLMGNEGGEGLEETNKEKEKWWENERKVFHGRVDSFIARMHLVQGDRRFSRWKGSVVDSVIGVFLTQNVSDHLSSSAFMSLAARFPLKSTRNQRQDNTLDKEPEISIINPDDTIKWHEVLSQPINSQSSPTLHECVEQQRGSDTSGIERRLVETQTQSQEGEFFSSQGPFDSITLGIERTRSCSDSNSEAEGPTGCRLSNIRAPSDSLWMEKNIQELRTDVNGSLVLNEESNHEQIENGPLNSRSGSAKLQNFPSVAYSLNPDHTCMQVPVDPFRKNELHMAPNSEVPELGCLEALGEESISSWSSTATKFIKKKIVGEQAESFNNCSVQQNGLWKYQKSSTTNLNASFGNHSTQKEGNPQAGAQPGQSQPSCNSYQYMRNNTFQSENKDAIETVKLAEALTKTQDPTNKHVRNASKATEKASDVVENISVANAHMHKETKMVEPNSKDQICSADHARSETRTKLSKERKGNAVNMKKNAIDWDYLRKQVEKNGRRKERGINTMDSLDYEAVRHANVKEIADAIKERGMNNMLAERIKEFLNRLVREHGSVDLEWLRDVPPDKAKDYLLSFRGLGLKSVECVRLLTLHHLAFPVDTNVGRIAVRLGWVPLQPLPESLQLHLLELYPILESIQKYLWPRLCKLDQRTLYELHYQMITFGKVFCTKSKPNCNACPMRGECRHFASAFASARLALPGPEEKSIVSSTVSIQEERNPALGINFAPLPPPENYSLEEARPEIGKCEPIIEVPATPEQECTEVPEVDIEDSFYEDPDEIPTIKLNIEEFTVTVQNFMQKNMELREADMSKALVALNPEAASIPTPKLKNVSRLRTEHQVYELPDSHPLLEGLDRREPDDPSPYLLAIWTPGETANSIQLPERRCSSQETNKLCKEKTCFSCNSIREANSQTVRGTLLIPCRTAMRGSFPLNGTYFQVNEVFADHDSSLNPIDVPREWIWNLPRRIVYFGTSVSTIFKGLSTQGIQYCFWKGFVCVRGFDQTTRAPRPLMARLHFPATREQKAM
ncbi:hypothetical protein FNV43_RR25249 [Rhamnella rubrinervis]|uniref:HhH-GPD domain-containing protein n=1 Tax=Rhamnella rubrinervis TaxID=2594499 RepID=A0A8K0DST3_9ROSA|nr:hypothetical protein FNV43_RR25249 [Rhamnella rubrinervis]